MVPAKFYFFLIISFLVYNTSWATNYYVDKNATGSNSGTSWTNAWSSFGSINWNSIQAGDTLFISGGTTSKTYSEGGIIPTVSGTADARITITKGIDAGHNGEVIITTPQSAVTYPIHVDGEHYITVSYITVDSTGKVRVDDANGVTFDNIIMQNMGASGFRARLANDFTLSNSTYTTSTVSTSTQQDGIQFNYCEDIIIEYNTFNILNSGSGHNDGIQKNSGTSFPGSNGIIRGNYCNMDNTDVTDSQGMQLGDLVGNWYIYNNVWDGKDYVKALIKVSDNHSAYVSITNNTIIGGTSQEGHLVSLGTESGYSSHITFKNNIIVWSGSHSASLINLTGGGTTTDSIDYNIYYSPDDAGVWNGSSWASWQSGGRDANGYNIDPDLDANFEPDAANDPPVDAGTTIIYFSIDRLGITRPQGDFWDIGAYEMIQGPDTTPPEVTGATLLDSVNLKITFSEPLDPITAQNISNYSINNGITIVSALLTGTVVTLTTSPHSNGTYTVTVSNVKDIAGNIVSPTANSADYDWTVIQDVTPPEVVSAEAQDSVTLTIIFSEPLEQSSAQNKNNYSITNGIDVLTASLSGSQVILTTSDHSPGSYNVTVNNVTDLAGNLIDPNNNSADYEVIEYSESVSVSIKSFLEGPYNDDAMLNDLSDQNLIPLAQPYYDTPWNYPGDESVSEIPSEVIDWVLVEIRSGIEVSSIVAQRAAFLFIDGTIKDLNGETTVDFPEVSSGHYYVVVHHRNHLSIMTKDPIFLSESSELYDFTTSLEKAYGNQPMKLLAGGKFGLYAADGNASGKINNADNRSIWRKQNGSVGYKSGDFDLNGGVNIKDKIAKYKPNKGRITGVPMN